MKAPTAECPAERRVISLFYCLRCQDVYASKGMHGARCFGCRHRLHGAVRRQRRREVLRGRVQA